MRFNFTRGFLLCLVLLGAGVRLLQGAEPGVALAIIYDTSGSMKDPVRDTAGGNSPKYLIANKALIAVADQLQVFAGNTGGPTRKVEAGLFTFQGSGARLAIPFGPLDAQAMKDWARKFSNPTGPTPLGSSLQAAHQVLLKSSLARKHVLVITDGINSAGPSPAETLPRLNRKQEAADKGVQFHFVAFDVDATHFTPLKKLGATVVSAGDGKQLAAQLEYILQEKILLEEEEPKTN